MARHRRLKCGGCQPDAQSLRGTATREFLAKRAVTHVMAIVIKVPEYERKGICSFTMVNLSSSRISLSALASHLGSICGVWSAIADVLLAPGSRRQDPVKQREKLLVAAGGAGHATDRRDSSQPSVIQKMALYRSTPRQKTSVTYRKTRASGANRLQELGKTKLRSLILSLIKSQRPNVR
jgi:hypothetical protein